MRGKAGLVVGLAVGYVLGTRAGRKRYEQIKTQAMRVWELDAVQTQVAKVERLGTSALFALPRTLFAVGTRLFDVVSDSRRTPGEKVDAALAETQRSAAEVEKAAEASAKAASAEVKRAATRAKRATES